MSTTAFCRHGACRVCAGAIAGAAVALLYAPASGEETRRSWPRKHARAASARRHRA